MKNTAIQELIAKLTLEVQSKLEQLKQILPQRTEHSIHGEIFALNEAIKKAKAKLTKGCYIPQPIISPPNTSKMKASELRICNLLDYHGQQVIVLEIKRDSAEFGYFNDSIGFERFYADIDFPKPIPLTEELLVRLGFNKSKGKNLKEFILGDFIIYTYPETGIELYYGVWSHIKIQYVHQLQNLYFTLTGTELTLKPNN